MMADDSSMWTLDPFWPMGACEVTTLAGTCCKATAVLRLDDATASVRLLALSDFPGRQHLKAATASPGSEIEADLFELPQSLQQVLNSPAGRHETTDIQALVAQNPRKMGYLGVVTVVKHIRGEKVEPLIDTGCVLVTKENQHSAEVKAIIGN